MCGEFYNNLIGWNKKEIDSGPMGTYALFQQDGKDVAEMMDPTGPIDTRRWISYVAVDNIAVCAFQSK